MGGHVKPMLRGAAADEVHRRLAAKPDWTVRALAADLKAAGIDVSHDTVWRFLRREGKTFKKNADRQRAGQAEGGALPKPLEDPSTST
ncbi:transposase [Sinorhizobium medicae]